MTITADLNVKGMENVLDVLKALPKEVASKRGGPVRAAVRAGARVIRDEAAKNLEIAIQNPGKSGITKSSGLLLKNLKVTGGRMKQNMNGERAVVRVMRRMYPDGGHTVRAGQLMEYGSSKQPAIPWLRPAAIMKAQAAIDAMSKTFTQRFIAITKKYLRK